MKHLIGLEYTSAEDIEAILDDAIYFKEVFTRSVKKVPTLQGKTVVNLFFEPSTRTRVSFELAAKRMSADVINLNIALSSTKKGETLVDTARTIESMASDIIVIRHSSSGAPLMLSRHVRSSVVNAGDGTHEHPTQALLDMFTIKEKLGSIRDVRVLIVGDIMHSRVARSNIWGINKLGGEVAVCGPPTLIPPYIEDMGVKVFYDIVEGLKWCDVVNMLRIQFERQDASFFPTIREYSRHFALTEALLDKIGKDIVIMHPGPINRNIEIESKVADGKSSLINTQVTNGVAVRMSVFYHLAGEK